MTDQFLQQLAERLRKFDDAKQCSIDLGLTNGCRCLGGIISDMAVEAGVIEPPVPQPDPFYQSPLRSLIYGLRSISTIPKRVKLWAGIDDKEEEWIYFENTYFTFTRIAERIDEGTFMTNPPPPLP